MRTKKILLILALLPCIVSTGCKREKVEPRHYTFRSGVYKTNPTKEPKRILTFEVNEVSSSEFSELNGLNCVYDYYKGSYFALKLYYQTKYNSDDKVYIDIHNLHIASTSIYQPVSYVSDEWFVIVPYEGQGRCDYEIWCYDEMNNIDISDGVINYESDIFVIYGYR